MGWRAVARGVKASRFLLMGDIHLSDRPPSACTEDYLDDLFALLAETVTLAKRRKVTAVIWAGDVFHHKTPGRTSHATVRRLIDLARTYPCPVLVVPGNHDLAHDRLSSIEEGQPLGVMLAAGAVRLLQGWVDQSAGDVLPGPVAPVYGVPWLMRFDDALVADAFADWRDRLQLPREPADRASLMPGLVVAHAPLYPPGQELTFENYPARKWAAAMGNVGSVYYGHVHEPHGVYTVDGVTFANPGALSRGSLHEHNLTRDVQVALWDAGSGEFELVTVPHKSAEQVFRLDVARADQVARADLSDFLAAVRRVQVDVTSIEAVVAELRGADLDPAVLALAEELLAEAAA